MAHRLILLPTDGERARVVPRIRRRLAAGDRVELCGFGGIAAAARTATLVAALRPAEVVLAGIAGGLDERAAVGTAWEFARVAVYGIGAGTGADFLPAEALGWRQWPGDPAGASAAIGDVIECGRRSGPPPAGPLLLTACAAADGPDDVSQRRRLQPDALAEDMEGFGVAFACRLLGVPCRLIRGISNRAGDRDQAHWNATAALDAAADLLSSLLASPP